MSWDYSGGDYNFSSPDSGNWWDSGGFSLGDTSFNYDLPSAPNMPMSQQGGFGNLMSPQNLFGGLGGLTQLLGLLGGNQRSQNPNVSNFQKGGMTAAGGQLANFAQGKNPSQQMQMALLQAIAGGQGLPQGYAQNVEQAFQPQLGSLYNQATEQGRQRGFYDSPATSPAGGAILGPGLADIQGQMAQAKLGLMQSLPGLFNQPINQQLQGAQAYGNLFAGYPYGQTQQQSPWAQLAQGLGGGLTGIGQGIGQQQGQQQQGDFQNKLLEVMSRQQSPYQFGGYSGS